MTTLKGAKPLPALVPRAKFFSWEFYDELGRVCTKCKEYKLYSEYHKHKECRNGYNTVCKPCRKPLSKKNYEDTSIERRIWDRAKTRAIKRGIDFNLELSDIIVPNFCPVLGVALVVGHTDYAPSIDRIDSRLGYVKGNIQIISNKANRMKSNATVEEVRLLLKYMEGGSCEL
jgi:hypothetical protein